MKAQQSYVTTSEAGMYSIKCNFNANQCDQMARLFLKIWPFTTMRVDRSSLLSDQANIFTTG